MSMSLVLYMSFLSASQDTSFANTSSLVAIWFPVTEKHGWDGFGKIISAVSPNATPARSERIATNFTECG